jgi:rod shape-determining protein MreD
MKKRIVYFCLLFVAIVIQTSVLPIIGKQNAFGDIILMAILAGAILDGFFGFFWFAIFAGILYDFMSYTPIGVHALIFLSVTYFVSFFSRRISVELKGVGIFLFVVFVFIASIVSRIIFSLLLAWDLQDLQKFSLLFGNISIVLIGSLTNVLLFFICFYVLKKTKLFFNIN